MKSFTNNINTSKTVVAIGKFDGVHIGHRKLIDTAVKISKENNLKSLVYIVAPPKSNLIIGASKRCEILSEMGVDYYRAEDFTPDFMAMTPEEFADRILLNKLGCAHVVVGYDFRFGAGRCADSAVLAEICQKRGIAVTVIDEVRIQGADGTERTVSSTLIRDFISKGDFENANLYLGSDFCISGTVCMGRQLGRTIGIPTANIIPDDSMPKIANGVYASMCKTGYGEYLSITNIGDNPTVAPHNPITAETNIFGFEKDLYGEKIDITFLERLRGEEKFPSFDALKSQIEADRQYVLRKYGK